MGPASSRLALTAGLASCSTIDDATSSLLSAVILLLTDEEAPCHRLLQAPTGLQEKSSREGPEGVFGNACRGSVNLIQALRYVKSRV